jgi:hypothetical protein
MEINSESFVYERGTIVLNVQNVYEIALNPDHQWIYPNHDPSVSPIYGVNNVYLSNDNTKLTISNATVYNEGNYSFSNSGDCGVFSVEKHIQVIPLPTPCFDDIAPNQLYVRDSASGAESTVTCSVQLMDAEDDLYFHFNGPMFTYKLTLDFDYLPEKSSTFYLRNYYENASDIDLPDDELRQAFIAFIPSNASPTDYRLLALTEDVHIKRDGNQITVTLCNVRFKSDNDVNYVTAKMIINI